MVKPTEDDWRRQGQEKYLMDAEVIFRKYQQYSAKWDHDHCAFCSGTFSLYDGDLKEGYSTLDSYRWICEPCFNDFKEEFNWKIINDVDNMPNHPDSAESQTRENIDSSDL